jgi:hypothetical protein
MLSRVFKLTSNVPALRKAYRCAVRDDQAATALIDMAPDSHPIFRSEYMLTWGRQEEHLGNIGPRDPVALDADGAKFGEVSFDARTDGYLQDKGRIMTDTAHSSRSRVPPVEPGQGIRMQEAAQMIAWMLKHPKRL